MAQNGEFVRLDGSLSTVGLPSQIISADLDDDGGQDLVVRDDDDGTVTVYFGRGEVNGPQSSLDAPVFAAPLTIAVGLGGSDVEAADTTGDGRLDLVVTNGLSAQVSVLQNLGGGSFAAPVPYRAATGLSEIDSDSTPVISSQDATAGVAAAPLSPSGLTDLVTINPGSETLDVLVGPWRRAICESRHDRDRWRSDGCPHSRLQSRRHPRPGSSHVPRSEYLPWQRQGGLRGAADLR